MLHIANNELIVGGQIVKTVSYLLRLSFVLWLGITANSIDAEAEVILRLPCDAVFHITVSLQPKALNAESFKAAHSNPISPQFCLELLKVMHTLKS